MKTRASVARIAPKSEDGLGSFEQAVLGAAALEVVEQVEVAIELVHVPTLGSMSCETDTREDSVRIDGRSSTYSVTTSSPVGSTTASDREQTTSAKSAAPL